MTPDQYCAEKAAPRGSTLFYSAVFLPDQQRSAVTALHALRRELADTVRRPTDRNLARTRLDWWRREIDQCFAGEASHPVTLALQERVERINLPAEYFHELVDGIQMDLTRNRYDSFRELALYCHRTCGVIALLSAEIFGYRDRETLKYAEELGTALRLTAILRDVREDARRGRLYVPLDELHEHRINPRDLLAGETPPGLPELFHRQAQRARDYYRRSLQRLPPQDRYAQRGGLIMAAIQQTLLDEIEADGYCIMEHRLRLTPLRKLWIAWKTARRARR
ncbi:MAG: presqualene diphosphate synthase HpnD [Gammaproteobacteria bacterium]|jgi:phytoene synthase